MEKKIEVKTMVGRNIGTGEMVEYDGGTDMGYPMFDNKRPVLADVLCDGVRIGILRNHASLNLLRRLSPSETKLVTDAVNQHLTAAGKPPMEGDVFPLPDPEKAKGKAKSL
jgi:hypothetical protein